MGKEMGRKKKVSEGCCGMRERGMEKRGKKWGKKEKENEKKIE